MDREALASFLLQRRQELQPSDVGLSAGLRRRAVGLRREEVAQLASISTDYYARLEQRRGPQPSTQVLSSLARALRLTLDERDYLYRVCGHGVPDRFASGDHVAPALLRVLDRLSDTPALIISALGVTLAQNDPARALLGDERDRVGMERSEIYRWFAHPETERLRYPPEDRDRHGRAQVAGLRAAHGTMGAKSPAGAMVRELRRISPEFAQLWQQHEVHRRFEDHKVLVHPELGHLQVDCQALFTEDQSQALLVLTARPGSEAATKLSMLAVLGTQQFTNTR